MKPGGRLVYATCSLLRVENHDIVNAFVAAHPEFEIESATQILKQQGIVAGARLDDNVMLELWPHRTGTDGFFAAVFRKKQVAVVAEAAE